MRLADWEPRLLALLDEVRGQPFELGSHDCALFAGRVVEAVRGDDPCAKYRGTYTTAPGYMKAVKRRGHADFFGIFDRALGGRVAPLQCGRGDIVSNGDAVGMMWSGAALFIGEHDGLMGLPVSALQWGWRV